MVNLDRFKFRCYYYNYIFEGKSTNKAKMFDLQQEFFCYQSFESFLQDAQDGKCILMQSTGLKDKNGKLVFEGDIIQYTFIHEDGTEELEDCNFTQIHFRDAMFCYVMNVGTKNEDYEPMFSERNEEWKPYFVVIGNIYENPELLK